MKKIILGLIICGIVSYGLIQSVNSAIPRNEPLTLNIDHRPAELARFMLKHHCLKPYIKEYINAADQYQLDYRILPAISIKESGSKNCTDYPVSSNNPFGWGSGRIEFKSVPDAINYVTGQLANGHYYAGQTLKVKLKTYNSVNLDYFNSFMGLMNEMRSLNKREIKI